MRRTFYYLLPEAMELHAGPGLRVLASLGKREAAGVIVRVLPEKDADLTRFRELKTITRLLDETPLFPEDALEISNWMSARWGSPPGLCLGAFFAHAPKDIPPVPAPPAQPAIPQAVPEPPEIRELLAALAGAPSSVFLLRLAASGRTDAVYPPLFSAALREETAQGLLLVPDLSFIPPLASALELAFPGRVGSWHARLTPKKRAEAWAGAFAGRYKVVIATRTGVFLPFKNLRLGLMDGEDEEVYKQEEAEPFYHAREVLLRRMKAIGGSVVLASPCPSIESWGGAASGALRRFDAVLPPVSGPGPDVRILDMTQYPGDILARPLADSLRRAVAAGGQALLITGRKGYASRLFCANCGWMLRCEACGPGMTLQKTAEGGQVLLCSRCGRKEPRPEVCPKCGGKVFRDYGAGTQKAQEAVSKLLPASKIGRFDGDVLRGSLKAMRASLENFSKGECDVLVGTRIALRELGAPRLALVAFIDADSELSSADFRASEKAYRGFYGAWRLLGAKGELFIQTRESEHFVFSRLAEMDYPSFADGELAARKDFFYPPFSFIVKARFASHDRAAMDSAAAAFLKSLAFLARSGDGSEILGPVTQPGQEKRRFHSEYYLVKAASEQAAMRCMEAARALPERPGVKFFLEADPHGSY